MTQIAQKIQLKNRIIYRPNINVFTNRNYETILQPPAAPSAFHYQKTKLQALQSNYSKLARINLWTARHPLILATTLATIKSGTVDWMTQCGIEGRDRNSFNWSRWWLFVLFGMYCGFVCIRTDEI